jgi:hypothetical protein
VPDHDVKSRHGGAVRSVDGEPGRIADDVEAGVRGPPFLGEAAAQQAMDLDTPVQFLAQVLPAGVGDAQAQRQLEHGGRAGAVDGAHGGGGVPGRAVGTEVAQQSRLEQGGRARAMPCLAQLPGVQRQGGVSIGQRQTGSGDPGREQAGGDGPAALGPGRVGGEYGTGDRHPVQGEGASQLR